MNKIASLMILCGGIIAAGPQIYCAESGLGILLPERLGTRGGFSMDGDTKEFHQVELAAGYALPWQWQFCGKFGLATGIDASAGWLGDNKYDAFIISAGPEAKLTFSNLPLSFRFGSNPTYLSRFSFNHDDFGSELQFVSHVGLSLDVTQHLQVAYRLQHMSNGGIATPNPGLNMHMFGVFWLF